MYSAGVALKRKIAFPLFNTIKVCRRKEESGWHHIPSISIQHNAVRNSYLHTVAQGRRKAAMGLYKQFQCLQAGVSHFGQWTSRFPLFNKWRLELYASMYTRMYITHLEAWPVLKYCHNAWWTTKFMLNCPKIKSPKKSHDVNVWWCAGWQPSFISAPCSPWGVRWVCRRSFQNIKSFLCQSPSVITITCHNWNWF